MNTPTSNDLFLIRGGGLGDFLLTLPLIFEACNLYAKVHLYTRLAYKALLMGECPPNLFIHDMDAEFDQILDSCLKADVITFWSDEEWIESLRSCGTKSVVCLQSNPLEKPHVVTRFFLDLGWETTPDPLNFPWLGDRWNHASKTLWVHPGSGSVTKNADFAFFEKKARKWLAADAGNRVVFSFGEADENPFLAFKQSPIREIHSVGVERFPSLSELKEMMLSRAGAYLGNDSGPTHLAAMMGIPTEACFVSTDPGIWRPLGPRVKLIGTE